MVNITMTGELWQALMDRLEGIENKVAVIDDKISAKNEICGEHEARLTAQGKMINWLYVLIGGVIVGVVVDIILRR